MPKRVDGLALFGELERIAPGIPVVTVTAYASDETAQDAVRAGAAACLAKPFTAAQLLEGDLWPRHTRCAPLARARSSSVRSAFQDTERWRT